MANLDRLSQCSNEGEARLTVGQMCADLVAEPWGKLLVNEFRQASEEFLARHNLMDLASSITLRDGDSGFPVSRSSAGCCVPGCWG